MRKCVVCRRSTNRIIQVCPRCQNNKPYEQVMRAIRTHAAREGRLQPFEKPVREVVPAGPPRETRLLDHMPEKPRELLPSEMLGLDAAFDYLEDMGHDGDPEDE
jgi:hypothetical protein